MAAKRPARLNIGVEVDPDVLSETQLFLPGGTSNYGCASAPPQMAVSAATATNGYAAANPPATPPKMTRLASTAENGEHRERYSFVCGDAVKFLRGYSFTGREMVYLDPPYVVASRSSQRPIYKYEYTDQDHETLLTTIKPLDCHVMISGYWSELYADMLAGWRTITFSAVTRAGTVATEWLWMNYPEPTALHDYQYLGGDYQERWNLKKRKRRWVSRLQKMPPLERQMLLWAMSEAGFDAGSYSQ